MKYSAIILSGGESKRFGKDKGLFPVFQKPLISYVLDQITPYVDEVLIITRNLTRAQTYASLFPKVRILVDEGDFGASIFGAMTGLKNAKGVFSFLLPCDTPLLSQSVLSLLKQVSEDYNAVIPRWPTGYIEPLQAIYRTKEAYIASFESIQEGKFTLRNMISKLTNVLYISTQVIEQLNPRLSTFHNINTLNDLETVKRLLQSTT